MQKTYQAAVIGAPSLETELDLATAITKTLTVDLPAPAIWKTLVKAENRRLSRKRRTR